MATYCGHSNALVEYAMKEEEEDALPATAVPISELEDWLRIYATALITLENGYSDVRGKTSRTMWVGHK